MVVTTNILLISSYKGSRVKSGEPYYPYNHLIVRSPFYLAPAEADLGSDQTLIILILCVSVPQCTMGMKADTMRNISKRLLKQMKGLPQVWQGGLVLRVIYMHNKTQKPHKVGEVCLVP